MLQNLRPHLATSPTRSRLRNALRRRRAAAPPSPQHRQIALPPRRPPPPQRPGQKRVCAVVTVAVAALWPPPRRPVPPLLEGTIPYDKHAYLGTSPARIAAGGLLFRRVGGRLARSARDRAMALTQKIDRWPDCAGVSATATIVHITRGAAAACTRRRPTSTTLRNPTSRDGQRRARTTGRGRGRCAPALRACADVAGVPEATSALRTHGILLEPITATNAVGEVAEGVETVPEAKHVLPEEVTARCPAVSCRSWRRRRCPTMR